ncbi:hypothetical protein MJG53_005685 [Ovis ammon polii x Ovis aries]|uniref:Uncharacterized protein n=1 Tax=Ovis ammon polii x Ovis aries TaxID=2918886 RepID=A0ACB9V6A3_9CETA|nr:hypothetical protein MJG53_005685 [Ovis ammon polii x Ovis aries]
MPAALSSVLAAEERFQESLSEREFFWTLLLEQSFSGTPSHHKPSDSSMIILAGEENTEGAMPAIEDVKADSLHETTYLQKRECVSKDTRIFEFRVFESLDEHILNTDQQRWAWCEQQLQLLPLRPSAHDPTAWGSRGVKVTETVIDNETKAPVGVGQALAPLAEKRPSVSLSSRPCNKGPVFLDHSVRSVDAATGTVRFPDITAGLPFRTC